MRRWGWLLLLAGCHEFDDPSTVKDLRVLAVAAQPSEIILDDSVAIPEIAFTSLVVDPAGRPITYGLRACANDPRAPNAPGTGSEASGNYPAGGARSTVGSALCPPDGPASWTLPAPDPGPTGPQFTVRFTAEQLMAAFVADVFPGPSGQLHGGADLGLPIEIELTATAGNTAVSALKRVIFWRQALRADQRPNQNPVITEVHVYPERDPVTLLPVGPAGVLLADAPQAVAVAQPLWIEPVGAQAEPYLTTVLDRTTDHAQVHEVPAETLHYQFFATAGKFVPNETASELPFGATPGARVPLEARYEPPAAGTLTLDPASGRRASDVTIWIVVRDERGGASWVERRLRVSDR
jgi:hypothetical protein